MGYNELRSMATQRYGDPRMLSDPSRFLIENDTRRRAEELQRRRLQETQVNDNTRRMIESAEMQKRAVANRLPLGGGGGGGGGGVDPRGGNIPYSPYGRPVPPPPLPPSSTPGGAPGGASSLYDMQRRGMSPLPGLPPAASGLRQRIEEAEYLHMMEANRPFPPPAGNNFPGNGNNNFGNNYAYGNGNGGGMPGNGPFGGPFGGQQQQQQQQQQPVTPVAAAASSSGTISILHWFS